MSAPMQPPTKLAHVVLSLSPGGLERVVCALAASSQMKPLAQSVYVLDEAGRLAGAVEQAGGRVIATRRHPGFDIGGIFRLARSFRADNVQVVHTHGLDPLFYGGLAAWLARVPIRIHTQHNSRLGDAGWKQRLKFRIAARAMTAIVAVSREVERVVLRFGAPPDRTGIILNGVAASRFTPVSAPSAAAPVVGTVARLSPEKGADTLVEAFAAILPSYPGARLMIVGDGPERARLEGQANSLGLRDSVEFLGYRPDVAACLRQFDVFVLPSLTEGIPLALLEAMAAERAVVATAVGGVPEVIEDGESGILTPPAEPASMAVAIGNLLSDPSRRLALGARAAARVRERFGEDTMARAYFRLYTGDPPEKRWKRFVKRRLLTTLPTRRILWRGRKDRPQVSLTFDDGPDELYTPRILDCLRHYGARATFFLVGEKVRREPSLVERILAEGHEIGNHSYSHPDFGTLRWRDALQEVQTAEDALREAGQCCSSFLFRPPRGKLNLATLAAPWLKKMTVVMWSVDLKDFRAETALEIRAALSGRTIRSGEIILYHGRSAASLEALPYVIEAALDGGRKAVPVSVLGAFA
jgi:glycosyltransferase involved in cell wall biosynthesis/peptidoglycan/xylan/chitin deacetylase (PgdA/CDA1 family)